MTARTHLAAALIAACLCLAGCAGKRVNPAETGPKPLPITPPTQQKIQAGIDRGVRFLIRTQNSTGSWGTVRHKMYNLYAPRPGTQISFRAATTALCVAALIDVNSGLPGAKAALRRGEDWLLKHLPDVYMNLPHTTYNNWTHVYALEALVRMLNKEVPASPRRRAIRVALNEQLRRLIRYQSIEGGWGYYVFPYVPPHGGNVTFLTATVLIALDDARKAGIAIPRKSVDAGIRLLHRARRPDFAFGYQHTSRPTYLLSQKPGSIGRSQVCNAALYVWHDERINLKIIKTWLDRLFARNGWLSMARKQQFPHEGHYAIAAYFYYYSHYYAARCIDLLPPGERPHFQGHLAHVLLPKQEKDGSWWDFAILNFHQQYGTAFALMSLARCLEPAPAAAPGTAR